MPTRMSIFSRIPRACGRKANQYQDERTSNAIPTGPSTCLPHEPLYGSTSLEPQLFISSFQDQPQTVAPGFILFPGPSSRNLASLSGFCFIKLWEIRIYNLTEKSKNRGFCLFVCFINKTMSVVSRTQPHATQGF